MRPKLKYQQEIDGHCNSCQCPEEDYFEFEDKECYRFVFQGNHPNNFIPVAKINPQRILNDDCVGNCRLYGLSLFGRKDGALERYSTLIKSFKKFKQQIGTHIAKGIIPSDCGQITSESYLSHFELYEFENTDISATFNIIDEL